MNQFDRITQNREDKLGQAYIRDTDITVSEIVAPIVSDGRTVDSILAEYDDLELEDVHQALAFAVNDLRDHIGMSRSETFNKLTSLTGWAEIIYKTAQEREEIVLIEDKNIHITLEWFAHFVLTLGQIGMSDWHSLLTEADLLYTGRNFPLEKHHFKDIQKHIESDSHKYAHKYVFGDNQQIIFDLPDDLPYIQGNHQLNHALSILVSYDPSRIFTLTCKIVVRQISSTHIQCQIVQTLDSEYPTNNISKEINFLFVRGTSFSIAYRIIEKSGSQLQTEIIDDSVIFSFELPIWKDDA